MDRLDTLCKKKVKKVVIDNIKDSTTILVDNVEQNNEEFVENVSMIQELQNMKNTTGRYPDTCGGIYGFKQKNTPEYSIRCECDSIKTHRKRITRKIEGISQIEGIIKIKGIPHIKIRMDDIDLLECYMETFINLESMKSVITNYEMNPNQNELDQEQEQDEFQSSSHTSSMFSVDSDPEKDIGGNSNGIIQ